MARAIIVFDGVCNLCNGAVNFIIRHDPRAVFHFVPMQSELGVALLHQYQVAPEMDTLVLIRQGRVSLYSTAVLDIAAELEGGWRLLRVLRMIPTPVRDTLYRWVARHRYRLFGRRDQCRLPEAHLKDRFPEAL